MATINNISIYKGEAVVINFTMSPVTDITGWTISLTIRTNANDVGSALLTVAGVVVSAVAGTFKFTLTSAQTKIAVGNYAYDVQRIDAGGESVLSLGVLAIVQEVLYP